MDYPHRHLPGTIRRLNAITHTSHSEIVEVVDQNNRIIDRVPRALMRERNLIHRAAYIFVFSPLGSLCVQQRSADKDIFASYWDLAAGGIPNVGECYADAALRELGEELGIYRQTLTPHGEFYYGDAQCKVWGSIYSLIWDGDIIPQAAEISAWRYISVEDLPGFLSREAITPTTRKAYMSLLDMA